MDDTKFNDLMYKKSLLGIALREAETRADDLLKGAGNSISAYQEWRAWSLILKAVSREIAEINAELGVDFLNAEEGLYLSLLQASDFDLLKYAEREAKAFYMDRLAAQDILMASAFDLARQATAKLAA